jgi:hypothetical protein
MTEEGFDKQSPYSWNWQAMKLNHAENERIWDYSG